MAAKPSPNGKAYNASKPPFEATFPKSAYAIPYPIPFASFTIGQALAPILKLAAMLFVSLLAEFTTIPIFDI